MISTETPKPAPKRQNKHWQGWELDLIRSKLKLGASIEHIAESLNRSVYAVTRKIHREGIGRVVAGRLCNTGMRVCDESLLAAVDAGATGKPHESVSAGLRRASGKVNDLSEKLIAVACENLPAGAPVVVRSVETRILSKLTELVDVNNRMASALELMVGQQATITRQLAELKG